MSMEYYKKYHKELKKDPSFRGEFKSMGNRPKKTRQEFKDECDINKKIQKHLKMYGTLPVPPSGVQLYQDTTQIGDYRSALDRVIKAKEAFHRMDGKILKRFDNDPDKLIDFINDPANLEEGRALGIYKKDETPKDVSAKQAAGAVANIVSSTEKKAVANTVPSTEKEAEKASE